MSFASRLAESTKSAQMPLFSWRFSVCFGWLVRWKNSLVLCSLGENLWLIILFAAHTARNGCRPSLCVRRCTGWCRGRRRQHHSNFAAAWLLSPPDSAHTAHTQWELLLSVVRLPYSLLSVRFDLCETRRISQNSTNQTNQTQTLSMSAK